MYFVYVLYGKDDHKFYVGYTNNLERRINEHKSRQCHTTLRMANPVLIFYESFFSADDAKRREGYFKTSKGKKTLKLMLRDSLKANFALSSNW